MEQPIKFETVVKNSVGKHGMIQVPELKAIVGKPVKVTVEVKEEIKITDAPLKVVA